MKLNKEQKIILQGKKGKILRECLLNLIKYGTAMGAKELIPISSAHTSFNLLSKVARAFSPRRKLLNQKEIKYFIQELSKLHVQVKTTINGGIIDRKKWKEMGASADTYNLVSQTVKVAKNCGIMATYSVTPYLTDNIPLFGDHCSWSESSAILYLNSIIGARTNRDVSEISLYSALLGMTPNFGLHLEENRKPTHLIKINCDLKTSSDWGALGYFTGEMVGVGIPIYEDLRKRPNVEDCVQLCGGCSSSGPISMLLIPGVSPEAPDLEIAFKKNKPKSVYIFDENAKKKVFDFLNYQPKGKVDLIFLGCPYKTLHEVAEIACMLEGKRIARGTRLWISTSSSFRSEAEELGYAKIIEEAGGELYADGCPVCFYVNSPVSVPKLNRIALDSAKQAFSARRSLHSNIFFGNTQQCIEIALKGEIQ